MKSAATAASIRSTNDHDPVAFDAFFAEGAKSNDLDRGFRRAAAIKSESGDIRINILAPGSKAASHHHAGIVFAYVLAGTVRSQLNDGEVDEYHAGQ
jgi:quercetin dioxygenase-like cupin family protein